MNLIDILPQKRPLLKKTDDSVESNYNHETNNEVVNYLDFNYQQPHLKLDDNEEQF